MEENKTISQEELEQLMRDAEQGDAEAQYELAICYRNGSGVEEDLEKYIYWLRLSAEQGWSHAIFRMCLNYAWGTGVEKDIEKAKYWYFKGEKADRTKSYEVPEDMKVIFCFLYMRRRKINSPRRISKTLRCFK